jgi:hypothetical protein
MTYRNFSVKVWEIENIPLKAVWVPFTALTVSHLFCARFFVGAIQTLRVHCSITEQQEAYEDLLVQAGSYVSVTVRRVPQPGKHVVQMSLADASTWIAHAGAAILAIAVLPWWWHDGLCWPGWGSSLAIAGLDLILLLANWWAGSVWAVAVSSIGTPAPVTLADNATLGTSATKATSLTTAISGVLTVSGALVAMLREGLIPNSPVLSRAAVRHVSKVPQLRHEFCYGVVGDWFPQAVPYRLVGCPVGID